MLGARDGPAPGPKVTGPAAWDPTLGALPGTMGRMRIPATFLALVLAATLVGPAAHGEDPAVVEPEAIPMMTVFGGSYQGYWWDHADLTVAVRVAPTAPAGFTEVAHDAIAGWDAALRAEYGGVITLTDVSSTPGAAATADIVVHYVPRYGGTVYLGRTLCGGNVGGGGGNQCNNVIVKSDVPQKFVGDATPEEFFTLVQHELGHALGIGHTLPIDAWDVMGYGWVYTGQGVPLSQCDLDAVGAAFGWALAGEQPHPPAVEAVYCS